MIGAAGDFASLPDGATRILAFAMLLARVELLTVLALLRRASGGLSPDVGMRSGAH